METAHFTEESRRVHGMMSGAEAEEMQHWRAKAMAREPEISLVQAAKQAEQRRIEEEEAARKAELWSRRRQGQPGRMYRKVPEFKMDLATARAHLAETQATVDTAVAAEEHAQKQVEAAQQELDNAKASVQFLHDEAAKLVEQAALLADRRCGATATDPYFAYASHVYYMAPGKLTAEAQLIVLRDKLGEVNAWLVALPQRSKDMDTEAKRLDALALDLRHQRQPFLVQVCTR